MKVHARFHVHQHTRFPGYYGKQVILDKFTLSGVQGEPFGSATPSASMELVIHNPEAAQVFIDAFESRRDVDVIFSLVDPAQE